MLLTADLASMETQQRSSFSSIFIFYLLNHGIMESFILNLISFLLVKNECIS